MDEPEDISRLDMKTADGFLNVGGLLEAGLVLLALGLGWWCEVDPLRSFGVRAADLLWGALAAGGMLAGLFVIDLLPIEGLRKIKRFVVEFLGPPLSRCRWYELLLLAALVGYSEELLFRGFLQPWFERSMNKTWALVWSNVVFGLLHAVTLLYGLLAAGTGMLLGWLLDATGERRLLAPMTAHALYDFVAFYWIVRAYRRGQSIDATTTD